MASLANLLTHLREIRPDKPTWIAATDAPLEIMIGVCRSPTWEWNVSILAVDSVTKLHLLMDVNPGRDLTIKKL